MSEKTVEEALHEAWADHSRLWEHNKWVYPVISRRAHGISIGVNLNPDKSCSFSCAYCQVDRTVPGPKTKMDLRALEEEIIVMIEEYKRTGLATFANFKDVPQEKRLIQDICLSGDGESTLVKEFPDVCSMMRKVQGMFPEFEIRLTLITNATHLQADGVVRGLAELTANRGEIWAKLDAGSEEWLKVIDRTKISLETIQENLEETVKKFPMRVQTMLCNIGGRFPDEREIALYIDRVEKVYNANPKNFLGVQLYGVVRHTALPDVTPLPREFLEGVAKKIRERIPVVVEVF